MHLDCLDLRCLLHVFHSAHERSRALAGAKFGQRSKSWSRTRIISRGLAGAVKCIAMTSELLTYLGSRALFIGAARHVQTCVCMRSPMLHEFRCLKYCAQGKGFHIVRAASQHAFEKFPNISSVLYGENSHMRFSGPLKCIRMKPSGCHPAIRTSGAARILFESMLFFG